MGQVNKRFCYCMWGEVVDAAVLFVALGIFCAAAAFFSVREGVR